MVISILALLFIAAAVFLVGGLAHLLTRAKPILTEPRCTVCDYDLRAASFINGPPQKCPECGGDLSLNGAVRWGKYATRSRKPVVIAFAVLAMLGFATLFMFRAVRSTTGPMASASLTNAQVLANLAKTAGQPWDWQELERRMGAGTLNASDIDAAIAALITNLKTQTGPPQPLHWAGRFVTLATQSGQLSDARLKELFQTYYGNPVEVHTTNVVREGKPISLDISDRHPWTIDGTRRVWWLKEALLDGKRVRLMRDRKAVEADDLSGGRNHWVPPLQLDASPTPGQHKITLVFDSGAIAENTTLRGRSGRPGTPDKWPDPLTTWETRQDLGFRTASKDEQVVFTERNGDKNPMPWGAESITKMLVRAGQGGSEVVINWRRSTMTTTGLCSTIRINIGNESHDLGLLAVLMGQAPSESTYQLRAKLPPGTTADLLLTPAPDIAEQINGMDRIWGKPIEIKGIPVERYDIEK